MFPWQKQKTAAVQKRKERKISRNLKSNVAYIEEQFSYGINFDFVSQEIVSPASRYHLFFYSTTIDTQQLSDHIISPLLEAKKDIPISRILTVPSLASIESMNGAEKGLTAGSVIIFKEGSPEAFEANIQDFKHRSIEKADNERTVKGPKDSLTESLTTNISMIRKKMPSKDLIAESIEVGVRPADPVTLVYVRDLVNNDVLENIKKRIQSITVDNIRNVEVLEQFLEERPRSLFPTMLYTERPDNAANYVSEGFIAIMMDNSSSCLIAPITIWGFFHSPEDIYLRWAFGNFSRLIRAVAYLITLFVSATYVAITNYHVQLVPIDLLLAVASSRERVPLPITYEVLLMELAFELIREAGVRIPSPLGPTIGIVGALILGQAAVEANIVSPIVVILVALSGLSSFTAANYSINHTLRISRFIFILAASLMGALSLLGAIIIWLAYAVSLNSFGVPYFSPATPHTKSSDDTYFRKLLKNIKWRPVFLKPKDVDKK
ncbi:spore germination protein KA [Terribacillus halophilus]|uniref:Spore germination protein KA n=1 Tax=Terribacillus halophilus TaxID=361279 RepID=A0A1G6M1Q8_9BACI|nr:spore germination protein [Terribacillus halophilus]SDC49381.1 spore germination protein KA [Terribacillus halophilus]